jgi:hypothetical protein
MESTATPVAPEYATERPSRSGESVLRGALLLVQGGPVLILIVMCIVMTALSPYYFTAQNLTNLGVQTSVVAAVALGELLVVLTRGVDLSVGSVVGLSGVLGSTVAATSAGHPIFRVTQPQRPWLERYATLATLVYDVSAVRMWLRDEMRADGPFHELPLPPSAWAQKSPSSSSRGSGSGARIAAIQSGCDVGTPSSK